MKKDIFEQSQNSIKCDEIEWEARVELALAYRLVDYYGWNTQVYNHISLRIPNTEHILINAFGLMYDEIKPSNLVKIDLDGNKLDDSPYPINKAGFLIHSCIHKTRNDLNCVMHTHDIDIQAISALKGGFIPLVQEAYQFYERIGYHKYEGIVLDESEQERLVKALGNKNHTLILHNHGVITTGKSVASAFVRMYHLIRGCKVQLKAMAAKGGEIIQVSKNVIIKTREQFESGDSQAGAKVLLPEWPAYYRMMKRIDSNWDQ
jgi:adducin